MDPWRVLGVEPGADPAAIHAAYRRRAWRHHPDRGGSLARMRELNAAYSILRRMPSARYAPRPKAREGSADPPRQPPSGEVQRLASRARAWLVGTNLGQRLGCLMLLGAVHGIALLGAGEWSPLEVLAALLALRLHALAVPTGQRYAPMRDAIALLSGCLRIKVWSLGRR